MQQCTTGNSKQTDLEESMSFMWCIQFSRPCSVLSAIAMTSRLSMERVRSLVLIGAFKYRALERWMYTTELFLFRVAYSSSILLAGNDKLKSQNP